jgi:hypothetical protein
MSRPAIRYFGGELPAPEFGLVATLAESFSTRLALDVALGYPRPVVRRSFPNRQAFSSTS